jgi:hypothetical protein
MKIVTVVSRNLKGVGFQHVAEVVSISNKILLALKPKPNTSVFWSGQSSKDVSVKTKAHKFAKCNNKETVNMALRRLGIKIPTVKQNPLSWRIWEIASKILATRARGEVDVVLGEMIGVESVWMRIEKPALMKNEKVHKITEHRQLGD